ncbi:SDR family NAD(P)-dependent oxidoreductase [Actinoplanes sp. NPDC051513]
MNVVLITGANRGIGRAAAERLSAMGTTVVVGARDARQGREAAVAVAPGG